MEKEVIDRLVKKIKEKRDLSGISDKVVIESILNFARKKRLNLSKIIATVIVLTWNFLGMKLLMADQGDLSLLLKFCRDLLTSLLF